MGTSHLSPAAGASSTPEGDRQRRVLALAALGVVYGDIGTSPIYAIRECFTGEFGVPASPENILGVLSLVVWSLTIVVAIKYLTLVLRADNHGEGGALALTALLLRRSESSRRRLLLVAAGLFAASLLYGDGMITPAISVLSAVEGIQTIAPAFSHWVVPVAVAILAGLFMIQRHGTSKIGFLFGPIVLLWFAAIAALGVGGIASSPGVVRALSPTFAYGFLVANGVMGFLVLGAVFLVVTGAEALYADLGHFGAGPIRTAWFGLVFPALLLNYFGQGALLLESPELASRPFYALAPGWFQIPLVILATATTIIASQAVISGAFSLTNQAIKLGYCPRMRVVYTSKDVIGQVYIPFINWILMAATIGLVLGFGSSSKLAAAYGVAVTTTMLVTTVLFFTVARTRWHWSRTAALLPAILFLVVDLSFFGANVSKILHGAWFPLAIGGFTYAILSTWRKGRELLRQELGAERPQLADFMAQTIDSDVPRVPGKAIFMTPDPMRVPTTLTRELTWFRVLHEEITIMTVIIEQMPNVPRADKVTVEDLGHGFHRVIARFGFQEEPNAPYVLALAREQGLDFPLEESTFFLGRERPVSGRHSKMTFWRGRLFAFLLRNALGATAYFRIPPDQVVELGSQIEI